VSLQVAQEIKEGAGEVGHGRLPSVSPSGIRFIVPAWPGQANFARNLADHSRK
jgi:hypothetical protein